MVRTQCKRCGKSFWETYRGARAETGELGQDLCQSCEDEIIELRENVAAAEDELTSAQFALRRAEKGC